MPGVSNFLCCHYYFTSSSERKKDFWVCFIIWCIHVLNPILVMAGNALSGREEWINRSGHPPHFCRIKRQNAKWWWQFYRSCCAAIAHGGIRTSHLYLPSSKRHVAQAIISGHALFIVCLVVGTLGAEPNIPPRHNQTESPRSLTEWGLGHHH